MSRILFPLLSTAVAIVIAVAAVLVGMRFAAPTQVEMPTGTEVVPVLAPVALGDEAPPAEAADGALLVSPAVAQREVRLPADVSAEIDPSLADIIDTLTAAADPAFAVFLLGGGYGGPPPESRDDPCAPREGVPAGDCPIGLMSTALPALVADRGFALVGQAFPPTYEQYLDSGNPLGGALWCDGLTADAGAVPFGIQANAPGTFSIDYWPTDRPGDTSTVTGIATADADADAWLASIDTAETVIDLPVLRSCFVLEGLEPGTAYTAIVHGTDIFDRVAEPYTARFHSDGAPVHPGAQISTVGENLIFVSGLHPTDESVSIRVTSVGSESTPDCSAPAGAQLESLTRADTVATAEQLSALRAFPDFTQKHVETFPVPEGSTVLVCVRWYAAGDAASWERQQPLFESSAVVQSPDRLLPIVTLESLSGADGASIDRIGVDVSSAEGTRCLERLSVDLHTVVPVTLCRTDNGLTGVRSVSDRLWDVGFRGDLVVSLEPRLDTGESAITRYLIPSRDGGCRGACDPPATAWYTIALDPVRQGTGLCGSFFGSECTPPTRDVAVGTAQVAVSWVHGQSNGQSDWNVTPTIDLPIDAVMADLPQINTDNEWSFTEPDPYSSNAVTGSILVEVDRPVTYTLRFGNPGAVPSRCGSADILEVSGRIESSRTVQMPGICLGAVYSAQIELVDDEGRATVWSSADRASWWGAGSLVQAPTVRATLTYDLRAQSVSRSAVDALALRVGAHTVSITGSRSVRCTPDGIVESHGTDEIYLASDQTVEFSISIRPADGWSPDECSHYSDTREENPVRHVTVVVPLADLLAPEGAVIRVPDAYSAELVLRARPVP